MNQEKEANHWVAPVVMVSICFLQIALAYWLFFCLNEPVSAAESPGIQETSFVNGEEQGQVMVTGILSKVTPIGVGPNSGHVVMLEFQDGFTVICWGMGYSAFKVGKPNHITLNVEGQLTIDWPR